MAFTLLMGSLTGMRQYASFADVQDDLTIESQKIVRALHGDLAQSGWYFPDGVPDTTADRSARYYPYVLVQSPGLVGSQFAAFTRTPAQTAPTTPGGLPGDPTDFADLALTPQVYATSFYAHSQEIVFLRVLTKPFSTRPSVAKATLDFSGDYAADGQHYQLGLRKMSDYKRLDPSSSFDSASGRYYIQPSGATAPIWEIRPPCLWLRPVPTDFDDNIPIMWECTEATPRLVTDPVLGLSQVDPTQLREYTYAVVPHPLTGRGQLVRAYRLPRSELQSGDRQSASGDTPDAIVVDEVISDMVDRITFDTYRSDLDALGINQVRVRIFISRQPNGPGTPGRQHRVIETVLALRTLTSPDINTLLGTGHGAGKLIIQ